jgi:hypothetical protein
MEPYTQEYLTGLANKNAEKKKEEYEGSNMIDEMLTDDSTENNTAQNGNSKPENYYKYDLSGVIIHQGTSESGHYYSIIKDNKDNNTWYEFNDTNVKYYDINDLKNEAFGGTQVIYNRDNKKEVVEKVTNAYLLFFKRQYEEIEPNNPNDEIIKTGDKFSNISPSIMDRVDLDNLQYWVMKNLFSAEYNNFITDIIINFNTYDPLVKNYLHKNDNYEDCESNQLRNKNSINNLNIDQSLIISNSYFNNKNDYVMVSDKNFEKKLFIFACSFFFNVLMRSRDRTYLAGFVDILKSFINKDVDNGEWLLEEFSNFELQNEYLIESPMLEMRRIVVGVLYSAMIKCYKTNSENTILKIFIDNTLSNIYKYFNGEKDLTYLYLILFRYSSLGDKSKIYLFNVGVLHFLTFYFINKSNECDISLKEKLKLEYKNPSHYVLNEKRMNRVDRLSAIEELIEKKHGERLLTNKSDYYLIMTYSDLISNSDLNSNVNKSLFSVSPLIKDNGNPLSKYLKFSNPSYVKLLFNEVKSKVAALNFIKMIEYLCYNNIEYTNTFQGVLFDYFYNCDSYELEYVMIIFKKFLFINDSLKDTRVKYLFNLV